MHGTPTLVTAFFPLQLVFTALFAALFLGQARATPAPATCHRGLTSSRRHVTTHTARRALRAGAVGVGGGWRRDDRGRPRLRCRRQAYRAEASSARNVQAARRRRSGCMSRALSREGVARRAGKLRGQRRERRDQPTAAARRRRAGCRVSCRVLPRRVNLQKAHLGGRESAGRCGAMGITRSLLHATVQYVLDRPGPCDICDSPARPAGVGPARLTGARRLAGRGPPRPPGRTLRAGRQDAARRDKSASYILHIYHNLLYASSREDHFFVKKLIIFF